MKNRDKILGGLVFTAVMQASVGLAQAADFSVGVVVSSTGSGAVLGIPYKNVFESLPNQIAGQPVKYIVLNDESDVTTGVRNAKKLVEESNVDILIGSNSVPVTQALMRVAAEYKTPLISLGPIDFDAKKDPWTFSIPQPIPLMMGAVLENAPSDLLNRLKLKGGVQITSLKKGKFKDAGIKEGLVITHINQVPVASAEEVFSIISKARRSVLVEGVYPNGSVYYYGVGV